MPLIFLGVAAFLLNVALTRALALQRPQIAALKALGYSNRELGVALHQVGARHRGGSAPWPASASGAWLGSAMIELYNQYFRFPVARLPAVGRRRRRRRSPAAWSWRRSARSRRCAARCACRRPRRCGPSRRRATGASLVERAVAAAAR